MSEGLPFKHPAHCEHWANAPWALSGAAKTPESKYLVRLENEGPERGRAVPRVTSRGRPQAQTPCPPARPALPRIPVTWVLSSSR